MKRKTPEQILAKVGEVQDLIQSGSSVKDALDQAKLSPIVYYKYRKKSQLPVVKIHDVTPMKKIYPVRTKFSAIFIGDVESCARFVKGFV